IEKRKKRRFDLALPVGLLDSHFAQVSEVSVTSNVSSGGVLFLTSKRMVIGSPIKYVLTLTSYGNSIVNLYCTAKVLRIEKGTAEAIRDRISAVAISVDKYEFVRT